VKSNAVKVASLFFTSRAPNGFRTSSAHGISHSKFVMTPGMYILPMTVHRKEYSHNLTVDTQILSTRTKLLTKSLFLCTSLAHRPTGRYETSFCCERCIRSPTVPFSAIVFTSAHTTESSPNDHGVQDTHYDAPEDDQSSLSQHGRINWV